VLLMTDPHGPRLAPESARLLPLAGSPGLHPGRAPVPAAYTGPSPERRALLARRIRWFVAATITYNVIEALVALVAGSRASSTALVSFGLDSIIEVSSAAAVAWQFSARDHDAREARERSALRIIALSFFALAVYVAVEAVRGFTGGGRAGESVVGIVLAAVSLAVMPALSFGQRRAGRQLGSASAVADSHQTLLCTYLSAVLLVGLVLNATVGWWWADPLAAVVIAIVAVKEGREAWRGEGCCAPSSSLLPVGDDDRRGPGACACGGDCSC
jgi:divalent metal cation (Fe/Co/Zn/Cd) transporter